MKKFWLFALLLGLVVLTACSGGSEEGSENEEKESQEEASRSVTIEDANGEQTIEGTPEKVVVLEWSYAENMQALGMEPVGVAGLDQYSNWVNVGIPFGEEVEDVGTRQEPNLEAISRLNPDLIIGVDFRHEAIQEDLERIAPTVMFSPYSEEAAKDQFANMEKEFNTMAKIFDKEDKAEQVLSDMEDTFAEQQKRLEEAGKDGMNYVITQAFTLQDTPTLRLFTDNSMVAQIMNRMGMKNDYESEKLEVYGYTETTVEALQNYQDSNLFYIVQEEDNIFKEQLAGNPVWENLAFVQEDRTYQMPGDAWTFGGPLSAEVLAEQVVNAALQEN
ncbi:iron complex transport system substrate-binding protein [Halobacillus karajensis]|uniref:Ferric-citrate-binding protein n=1 Tax=Halobacillus karajensis TaxID=195088 RepID=A0A024P819_9BACI|nr:iron-siderophore ABC transporter substrate-binding protein [Halobacillus karajensis]CDQ20103.1 Ferric-citrate-binding protein [Halobacillus karajensis]CDQ25234.1 Ferric-citrate-binding protein [Halobacillus karajensis]CDQ28405.1 Ferric-citrate-binding protein [Halobacillus karajensis]SEI00648.1 iron complex transport system substrate-binding protein [Halobacillus karajensis]